jgi:hypothetical protein
MKTNDSRDPTLHWELFIRERGSATQGVPPGKEALTWVANTATPSRVSVMRCPRLSAS